MSHHKGVCSGGRTGKGRSDSGSPQLKAGAKKQELESGDDPAVADGEGGAIRLSSQKPATPRMPCRADCSFAETATISSEPKGDLSGTWVGEIWDFPDFVLYRQLPSASPFQWGESSIRRFLCGWHLSPRGKAREGGMFQDLDFSPVQTRHVAPVYVPHPLPETILQ